MRRRQFVVPKATIFAALTNPQTHEGRAQASDMSAAAATLGLKLHLLGASDPAGIERAFRALEQIKADALLVRGRLRLNLYGEAKSASSGVGTFETCSLALTTSVYREDRK